ILSLSSFFLSPHTTVSVRTLTTGTAPTTVLKSPANFSVSLFRSDLHRYSSPRFLGFILGESLSRALL
ncbi:unnamed protein product, partial [Brassica oleracea]